MALERKKGPAGRVDSAEVQNLFPDHDLKCADNKLLVTDSVLCFLKTDNNEQQRASWADKDGPNQKGGRRTLLWLLSKTTVIQIKKLLEEMQ